MNVPKGADRRKRQPGRTTATPAAALLDGAAVIARVLENTKVEVAAAHERRVAKIRAGKNPRATKESLLFAIYFARHIGASIADALRAEFPEVKSGENPSRSVSGVKRVDVNYSTPESGLGFAISLKSVHSGEAEDGAAGFTHNLKRNDEELRVEATGHHLRGPYAVLVAVVFLPFESCQDTARPTPRTPFPVSSFAAWVQYLWPLKGRADPEDPPDRFELVFVALYARDGTELGFYQVGGDVRCPRSGRPSGLLTFQDFLRLVKATYYKRNGKDFAFEGEEPPGR